MDNTTGIETHPWPPFLPEDAKVLILGTFPPGSHRWSMNFYYPNKTNDFWRICGMLFYGRPDALLANGGKAFDEAAVRALAAEKGIAMNDTGHKVCRLKGNASDKYLRILEPVDLDSLLKRIPECHHLATTGEKAAEVIAAITGMRVPAMGEYVVYDGDNPLYDGLHIWRMPSTSRAYPLALEKKAAFYCSLFQTSGIAVDYPICNV